MTSPGESHAPIPRDSDHVGTEFEEIRSACLVADGADPVDEAIGLRIKHAGLGEHDRFLLSADAGFLLALAEDATGPVELALAVRPDVRRQGHGSALLRCYLAGSPDKDSAAGNSAPNRHPARTVSAWSHGDHPAAARLAKDWAFDRVRELWVLRRLMAGPEERPIEAPTPPSGVQLRSYRAEDAAALLATNAAAFAEHPEQGAMDPANLAQRMAEPWFDPAGLLVAFDDGGRMLGFHWTKLDPGVRSADGRPVGEVYVIGVAPHAHGRGLGRVLMQAGLHRLATQGATEVILFVESDNIAALGLYASLGFSHADRDTHVRYQREPGGET